jgi:hypothetical protein
MDFGGCYMAPHAGPRSPSLEAWKMHKLDLIYLVLKFYFIILINEE